MQGRVFAFCAILAVAFAQQSFSVYELTSGVAYSGALPIQANEDSGYTVTLFSLWVPENASSVNVSLINTNNDLCDYVSIFVLQGTYPCNEDQYDNSDYRCGQGYDIGDGIGDSEYEIWVPASTDYLFEYQVNTYWYIAVGRYDEFDYDSACTYTVQATVNSTCTSGSIGLPYSLSSDEYSQCSQPYNTVSTYPSTFTVNGNEDTFPVFKVSVPVGTGNFQFTVNTSMDADVLEVYGRSYGAPSIYDYNCDDDSYTEVGNFTIYNVICYTPRSGDFYIALYSDYSDTTTSIVTFQNAPTVCANGTGGWNCSFVSVPFNGMTSTFTIPYNSGATYLSYAFYYIYMDIPANFSSNPITITASTTGSDSLTYFYRRNGYPEEDSTWGYESVYEYYGTPHSYTLTQFDWSVAGRIYFGFQCDTSPSCSVTASVNGTVTSTSATSATSVTTVTSLSSTSVSSTSLTTVSGTTTLTTMKLTTGTTTASHTTTTTGTSTSTGGNESSSSAAIVIPSAIFAIVAAALALF